MIVVILILIRTIRVDIEKNKINNKKYMSKLINNEKYLWIINKTSNDDDIRLILTYCRWVNHNISLIWKKTLSRWFALPWFRDSGGSEVVAMYPDTCVCNMRWETAETRNIANQFWGEMSHWYNIDLYPSDFLPEFCEMLCLQLHK